MTWEGGLPVKGDAEYGNPLWEDLKFPLTRDKRGQSDKPDFDFTNLGLLFPYDNAAEIAYIIAQLPHGLKSGSVLRPHIHFVQAGAPQPTFKMDYRWYENGADPTGPFTTLTATKFRFTYTSGSILQFVGFPSIAPGVIESLSSFLDIKLYRDDTVVSGDVLAKEFDLHIQLDIIGSRQEFEK